MISSQAPMRRPAVAARRPRKSSAPRVNSPQTKFSSEVSTVLRQELKDRLLCLHSNIGDIDNTRDILLSTLKSKALSSEDCFQLFLDVSWKDRYENSRIARLFHELTQLDDDDTRLVEGLTILLEKECNSLLSYLTLLKTPTPAQLTIVTLLSSLYHLDDLPEMHKEGVESYLIDIAKAFWAYFMPGAPSVCLNDDAFIDAVCDILHAVGKQLDVSSPINMERTFNKMTVLLFSLEISQYARLRLMEIKEARAAAWKLTSAAIAYYKDAYFKHIKQRSFDSGRPDSPTGSLSSNDDVFEGNSVIKDVSQTDCEQSKPATTSPGCSQERKSSIDSGFCAGEGFTSPRRSDDFTPDTVTPYNNHTKDLGTTHSTQNCETYKPFPSQAVRQTSGSGAGRGFRARGGFGSPPGTPGIGDSQSRPNIGRSFSEDDKDNVNLQFTFRFSLPGKETALASSDNKKPPTTHFTQNNCETSKPLPSQAVRQTSRSGAGRGLRAQGGFGSPPGTPGIGEFQSRPNIGRSFSEDDKDNVNSQFRFRFSLPGNETALASSDNKKPANVLPIPEKRVFIRAHSLLGNPPELPSKQEYGNPSNNDSRRQFANMRSMSEGGQTGHTGGFTAQRSRSTTTDNRTDLDTQGRFNSWNNHWSRFYRSTLEFTVNEDIADETDPKHYSRDLLLSLAMSPVAVMRPHDLQLDGEEEWASSVILPKMQTVKERFPCYQRPLPAPPSKC